MTSWEDFYGPNAGYAVELYERFRRDPNSVDQKTRSFFAAAPPPTDLSGPPSESEQYGPNPIPGINRIVAAARLARIIREYGHLAANINPLGSERPDDPMLSLATHGLTEADLAALPATIVWPDADGANTGSCLDAMTRLRAIYCGTLGYEFDHLQDSRERSWLHEQVESDAYHRRLGAEDSRNLLRRLTMVESFERFLHSTFPGQKRFSIEGIDMLIPMLDSLIMDAASATTQEVIIGMAHRGRLNVLAHILKKPYAVIFSEFHTAPNKDLVPSEGSTGINFGWTGDVKYHLGAERVLQGDPFDRLVEVKLTLAHNPSHLEFINPVIAGAARAAEEDRSHRGEPVLTTSRALPVTIHGDAAFPGEGVVAETLNLSRLTGYRTGGTIHIIANNQIGFTTQPHDGRSTLYASDLAKGFEIPIIHVNADDPEACVNAIRLAHAYRTRFQKDFLVDLIGYRRWGHNEGDEPAFTQPEMYAKVTAHPTVRELYLERLESSGMLTPDEARRMQDEAKETLAHAMRVLQTGQVQLEQAPLQESPELESFQTGLTAEKLRALNEELLARPSSLATHPRLERILQRRRDSISAPGGIDWGFGETLALASILAEGTPIRLTGQDTERGTFSQRHLVLHDMESGAIYTPLQELASAKASFAVYNSPLSEASALGFEYGYSVHAPETLVLWEAQFGDFANAGQVLIDQFIVSARAKWRQLPSLVLLLPHGYEGQGPDHSSARIERFLQLAAEDNLRIANCTTAAQYFHLLRAQAASLREGARPLIVLTPKSLLRHPRAASSLEELATGHFNPLLENIHRAVPGAGQSKSSTRSPRVQRLILGSGKLAMELDMALENSPPHDDTAVIRLEQLYPFPAQQLEGKISRYPGLDEVIWLQEEPRNMGAWSYVAPRLQSLVGDRLPLRYIGLPERASTAPGQADAHNVEHTSILEAALAGQLTAQGEILAKTKKRGFSDVE